MKMYMVRRTDYAVRPENMLGAMCVTISAGVAAIDHFRCWHRKHLAEKYIADLCGETKQDRSLFKVVTLEVKAA